MNLKIREAQLQKVPYMLVIGDKEVASATVSVRLRTGEQLPSQSIGEFKSGIKKIIAEKAIELRL
jgi:threonyl-tRNA synthetase